MEALHHAGNRRPQQCAFAPEGHRSLSLAHSGPVGAAALCERASGPPCSGWWLARRCRQSSPDKAGFIHHQDACCFLQMLLDVGPQLIAHHLLIVSRPPKAAVARRGDRVRPAPRRTASHSYAPPERASLQESSVHACASQPSESAAQCATIWHCSIRACFVICRLVCLRGGRATQ